MNFKPCIDDFNVNFILHTDGFYDNAKIQRIVDEPKAISASTEPRYGKFFNQPDADLKMMLAEASESPPIQLENEQ